QSVQTNRAFVDFSPEHAAKPLFMVQIADVWRMVGDAAKVRRAHADYVAMFATDTAFIQLPPEEQQRWRSVSRELADYYYHAGSGLKEQAGARAESAFATAAGYYRALGDRQDRPGEVLRLAGDAYLQAGDIQNALQSFQQAAYDTADYGEAADSGWAAITVLRQQWLEGGGAATDRLTGLTSEADRFADKFPEDSRVSGLMADLAGKWLEAGNRQQALKYAQEVLTNPRATPSTRYSAWVVTGRGRQQLGEFGLAERAWKHALDLTADPAVPDEIAGTDDTVRSQLATAIYRQGENAAAAGNAAAAVAHFRRVGPVVPGSDIAIKAQFDAGNTLLTAGEYALAIPELEAFRRDYPSDPLASEISEKLVHAFVSSDQPAAAAQELLDRAKSSSDPWPLKLRAAGLFHEAGSIPRRNQVYAAYLDTQPAATSAAEHIELQTLRHRLLSTVEAPDPYRQALLSQEMDSRWHSDQTLAWAARQSLILGAKAAASFATIRLGQPLAESLSAKQVALEKARKYFLDAEALAGDAVLSESLYRRAELYRALATDLMNSTVPGELNELEAMQYQMLLEEEAFPFEEKAIRLHADNHRRITSSGYDAWIGKSLDVLATLNPGRYDRSVRWMSWANDEEGDDAG
ncbi:MAG: outer membrane protein assembly factor BamD, partial [Gammaproteobacteria bacterium]